MTQDARFAVVLDDKVSGPAASAAGALAQLRNSIDGDKKALAGMQAAMKQLQSGTTVNIAAFKELQSKIEAHKSKISEATAKYVELGGTFGKIRPASNTAKAGLEDLSAAASAMPGPLGGLVSQLSSLKATFAGGGMAMGFLAVAAALVAVSAAALVAAAALAKFGLAAGNARRSERLHMEGIENMRSYYVRHRASAGEVQTAIDRVAASSATSRPAIASMAETLHRGGLRGATLTTALTAAATKAAVLGEESGRAFASFAVGAHRSGVGIDRLARDIDARFGRSARALFLDLDVMSRKLDESWNALFDGVDVEPVLKMFGEITQMFSQNTASGRALKTMITALFGPLASSAEGATPIVKRLFQGMIIAALHVTIAILTVRNWFRRTFRDSETLGGISGTTVALYAGQAAVYSLAAAFAVLGVAIVVATAPLWMTALAIYGVYRAVQGLVAYGESLGDDWADIGPKLVDGLVNGIKGAASRAVSAVRELGGSLANALKEALDIHSPSRVFASLGVQIPAGVEAGIESGTPSLEHTVGDMVRIPNAESGAGGTTAAAASGTTSNVFTFGDIHVHGAGEDAPSIARSIRDELANVLDGFSIQLGAPA